MYIIMLSNIMNISILQTNKNRHDLLTLFEGNETWSVCTCSFRKNEHLKKKIKPVLFSVVP